ncbi:MAG: Coenzyme F420 hydrogenase/dehydrogenase, beta subunit C-terminal domain [Desulfobacterales bacterium]
MATKVKLDVKEGDLLASLKGFFNDLLGMEDVSALLVPRRLPMKAMVMPTLISDPKDLEGADPLAPAFPMNTAKVVSKLSRKPFGGRVAVVLRPCEIRALVELVKLKQARLDELLVIGVDCLGAYQNKDYLRFVGEDAAETTRRFAAQVLSGKGAAMDGVDLASACQVCEHPVPEWADLSIGLIGVDVDREILLEGRSPKGEEILGRLAYPETPVSVKRKAAVESLVTERASARDRMFEATRNATDSLEKLTTYFAGCVNCYNCRVACPVCYCKECVFLTDVFNHEPAQYMAWARRKGAIKLPTDTVFYHLTRLAHMSTACVGCGQCTNACPNDIPVMEVFRTIAHDTQGAFDVLAGRDPAEAPPLSAFREAEFQEVVGIH